MLTTEGECRIGLSIGPICSSIVRVSWNGSASGMSRHQPRGPHVDRDAVDAVDDNVKHAGLGLELQCLASRLPRHHPADAAHAVAARLGLGAIRVVDADVGFRAGDLRRRAAPSSGRSGPAGRRWRAPPPIEHTVGARADRQSRSRCRGRSSCGMEWPSTCPLIWVCGRRDNLSQLSRETGTKIVQQHLKPRLVMTELHLLTRHSRERAARQRESSRDRQLGTWSWISALRFGWRK